MWTDLANDYAGSREANDPHCLRPGEAGELLAGHPWRRFVALGDSLIEGLRDPVPGYLDLSWADRVAAELSAAAGGGLDYLNVGRADQRVAQVRQQQLEPALAFQPDLALVVAGANDAIRPWYVPGTVDTELSAIIAALQAAGAEVITVSVMITSEYPAFAPVFWPAIADRLRCLGQHTAALAAGFGTIHCDVSDHPAATLPGMVSADGLHPNQRCQAIGAAALLRHLGAHLSDRGGMLDREPANLTGLSAD